MAEEIATILKLTSVAGVSSVVTAFGILGYLWLQREKIRAAAATEAAKILATAEAAKNANENQRDERAYSRLEKQYASVETALTEQNKYTRRLLEEHGECREDFAEARLACHFLYDQLKVMHAAMLDGGLHPPPLVAFPELRDRHKPETEFRLRQSAQKLELLQEQMNSKGGQP